MSDRTTNETTQEIPYGYCHCGCGQLAPIAKETRSRHGWVKGEPLRYICGHNPKNLLSTEERFWRRVNKGGPIHPILQTACWVWTKGFNHFGYGRFWGGAIELGAHRYSYMLHFGPIPEGIIVCHRCDNPSCVNPAHLFLGAPKENTTDMIAKNRHRHGHSPIGESNPSVKLTEAEVLQIRSIAQDKTPRRQIADQFGVSLALIEKIIARAVWKHI